MDSQNFIEYEICNPITYKRIFTRTRDEALGYYDQGWIVIEHHITIARPSIYNGTRVDISMAWNDNPEFKPKT
jgi:hypothetical protein